MENTNGNQMNVMSPNTGMPSGQPGHSRGLIVKVVLGLVALIAIALIVKLVSTPSTVEDSGKKDQAFQEQRAEKGKLVEGFPRELLPPASANTTINDSYTVSYPDAASQYSTKINVSQDLQTTFEYYKKYLSDQKYNIVTESIEANIANIYALKGNTVVSLVISKSSNTESFVVISYVQRQ